jgi:cytidylate kinase
MDKIIEKLSGVLSPEDLNEVKKAFESAVDERVQTKLDEETKNLAKKADEFCQKKIEEAVAKKTAELEDLANKYCEERCAKITEKAQKKLDSQQKKLEEAADQYICEYFDEKYKERFGQDLDDLEESLLTNLDKWLEMTISEKISPKLIQKQAVNETYEPIINAIKSAFEDQYVALDTTGSAKLREAKAEAAELRESLKKQVESGMRLSDKLDAAQKRALIAEKTRGLSSSQVSRVNKMFESKDYAETKEDIDEYVAMLNERAPIMKRPFAKPLSEKFKSNSLKVEDETQDIITEKFHPKKNLSESQDFLLKAASYLG